MNGLCPEDPGYYGGSSSSTGSSNNSSSSSARPNNNVGTANNSCANFHCPSYWTVSGGVDIPSILYGAAGAAALTGQEEVALPLALTATVIESGPYTGSPWMFILKSVTFGGSFTVDAYGNTYASPQVSLGKSLTPFAGFSSNSGYLETLTSGKFPTEKQTADFLQGPSISGSVYWLPVIPAISPFPSGLTWSPLSNDIKISKTGGFIGTSVASIDVNIWSIKLPLKLWDSSTPWQP